MSRTPQDDDKTILHHNCGYLLTWVISDNPCQNFLYRLLSNISLRWQWQLRVQLTERQLVCKHRGTLTSHHTTAPLPSCSVTLRSSYLSCQPALHWSSPLSPWMNDPPSAAARCSENIARWSKHKHKNMSQVNGNPQWPRHHQRQSRVSLSSRCRSYGAQPTTCGAPPACWAREPQEPCSR